MNKNFFLSSYPSLQGICVLTTPARENYNIDMVGINCTLYDFMRNNRAKSPDGTAFIRGMRKISFGRFFKEIDRVAGGLAALGVKKGDVVMLALPTIGQGLAAFYACSRIGAVASMIHPLMARGEFLQAVAEQHPKVVFLSDVNFLRLGRGLKGVKRVMCPFAADGYVGLPLAGKFIPQQSDGTEPAVYMRSGGTSGKPKTVVLSSSAVNALPSNLFKTLADDTFDETDRMLAALPLFHGFGLLVGIHTALSTNTPPVLLPVFKAKRAVKLIARHRITTVIAVPRMIFKLLHTKGFEGDNVSCLKNVYVGGDNVDAELEKEFDARMAQAGAPCRMSPGYGLTETCSVCVLSPRKVGGAAVGKPLENMKCRIVDEEGRDVPAGEAGELLLSGNQMMSGYLGDEKATAEVLFERDGETWLRTGDYFRQNADGVLYFMGRKKRLIKISGMNVFPSEIENTAAELPFVKACAAIEVRENGKPYIAVFVEGKPLSSEQVRALKAHIVDRLSHWHEPKYVISVESFPRTNIGKTDYVRLADEFESNRKKSS